MARAVFVDDYTKPHKKRVVEIIHGGDLRSFVRDINGGAWEFPVHTLCAIDGDYYDRDDWHEVVINEHSVIAIGTMPDGGGGAGGNKAARLVLMLALVVISYAVGAAAAGAAGLGTTTATGAAIGTGSAGASAILGGTATLTLGGQLLAGAVAAGLVAGGTALINIALPIPGPGKNQEPSPTYSLTGSGNRARLNQTVVVQFGRVRGFPDIIAGPWSEFAYSAGSTDRGVQAIGEQKLYTLYYYGDGEYDFEEFQVFDNKVANASSDVGAEETDIDNLAEIEIEVCPPGTPVTIMPTAVVSVDVGSVELKAPNIADEDTPDDDPSQDLANDIDYSSFVTASTEAAGGSGTLSDSTQAFTPGALVGRLLVFARTYNMFVGIRPSDDLVVTRAITRKYYVTIIDNDATTITYSAPVGSYLSGIKANVLGEILADVDDYEVDETSGWYRVETRNNWAGEFPINPAPYGLINRIGVDLILPEGLGWSGAVSGDKYPRGVGSRLELATMDDQGNRTGNWLPMGEYDATANLNGQISNDYDGDGITGGTGFTVPNEGKSQVRGLDTTWAFYDESDRPIRDSRNFEVEPGRYMVRPRRTTLLAAKDDQARDRILFAGLRGYVHDATRVFPNGTAIAVVMQSSEVVNSQSVTAFSAIGTRKLREYLGEVPGGNLGASPFSTKVFSGVDSLGSTDRRRTRLEIAEDTGDWIVVNDWIQLAAFAQTDANTTFRVLAKSYADGVTTITIRGAINREVDGAGTLSVLRLRGVATAEQIATLQNGALLTFTDATAVGGVAAVSINGERQIRILSETTFDFVTDVYPTATATGGGSSVAYTVGEFTGLVATRRISSAALDAHTNTVYGLGEPDSTVDFGELLQRQITWDSRDQSADVPVLDTFDYRFDQHRPHWEAADLIVRPGRARTLYPSGVMTIIRDEPREAATAVFSAENIIPRSFAVDWSPRSRNAPDYVELEFFNEDIWRWDKVPCTLLDEYHPDYPGLIPARGRIEGAVNRKAVWRLGMYELGILLYRRSMIAVASDVEGSIPFFLEMVEVTHPLAHWGQSGHMTGYDVRDADASIFTSEHLVWEAGSDHVMQLKGLDGAPSYDIGLLRVTRGAMPNEVIIDGALAEAVGVHIHDRFQREATRYTFGPAERNRKQCLVNAVVPRGNDQVELVLSNYAPQVYTMDEDGYIAPTQTELLNRPNAAPAVEDVKARLYGRRNDFRVGLSWKVAPDARFYIVEISTDDRHSWRSVATTTEASYEHILGAVSRIPTKVAEGLTIGNVISVGLVTYITRNHVVDTEAWDDGQYDGDQIRFMSGAYYNRAYPIRITIDNTLNIAASLRPLPLNGGEPTPDTYDIERMTAPTFHVSVRAVNRQMGPRSVVEVDLTPALVFSKTLEVSDAGEFEISRGSYGAESEVYQSERLMFSDSEGNVYARGKFISLDSNPNLASVHINEPVALVDAYRGALKAGPRDWSAVMLTVNGQGIIPVGGTPGRGEWSVADDYIDFGFDTTGKDVRATYVDDTADSDMDGIVIGEVVSFVDGDFTLAHPPTGADNVVLCHQGVWLIPGGPTPGPGEFYLSGGFYQDGLLGRDGRVGDVILAMYVRADATATAKRLRIAAFEARLPTTPLFTERTTVVTGGRALHYVVSAPKAGQFALAGAPKIDVVWGQKRYSGARLAITYSASE